jgi:hypothetical protein
MEFSMFRSMQRWMKRVMMMLSPADRHYRHGRPRPVGRHGLRIWTARTLDWHMLGYLVTAGDLAQPVAFVFGSVDDPATRICLADFRKAHEIATERRHPEETPFVFDLREFNWEHPGRLAFILDLVLYPTDGKGYGVFESSAGELHGAMLDYDGLRFALFEGAHERSNPLRTSKPPTFDAAIAGGGWCKVPDALNVHLGVEPRPDKKSGLPVKPLTLTPGSNESGKAESLTAA